MSVFGPQPQPASDPNDLLAIIARLKAAGIEPGGPPDTSPVPQFQPTGVQNFLSGFGGMEAQPMGPAHNFGEGLLQGLTRGLGQAGTRVQQQRAKFEQDAAARRAAADAARLDATKTYRTELYNSLKQADADRAKATDEQRTHDLNNPLVTQALLNERPYLARQGVKVGDRVPASVAFAEPIKPAPEDNTLVQVQQPDGSVIYLPRNQAVGKRAPSAASATKPSTGEQKQALAFYQRANDALDILKNPDATGSSLEDRIASVSPALTAFGQVAPNVLKGQDRQLYEQAQKAFTQAKLRKESGAAISQAEYDQDAKTYFVQPGDPPAVVAQKRAARQAVLDGLKFQSGPAYEEFYGAPSTPAVPGTVGSRTQTPAPALPAPGGWFAKNAPKAVR